MADYLPLDADPEDPEEEPKPRLAGGGSHPGENPKVTGGRELQEETGLKLKTRAVITLVYERSFKRNHRKYGLLVSRADCKGAIRHRNPPKDKKIRFVGYRWLTFTEALEEIKPVLGVNRSQHDILIAAREELVRMGLEHQSPANV